MQGGGGKETVYIHRRAGGGAGWRGSGVVGWRGVYTGIFGAEWVYAAFFRVVYIHRWAGVVLEWVGWLGR